MDVTVSYGMRLAEASIKLIRGNHLIARSPFRCLVLLQLRFGLRLTPGSMASGSSCVRRGGPAGCDGMSCCLWSTQ